MSVPKTLSDLGRRARGVKFKFITKVRKNFKFCENACVTKSPFLVTRVRGQGHADLPNFRIGELLYEVCSRDADNGFTSVTV